MKFLMFLAVVMLAVIAYRLNFPVAPEVQSDAPAPASTPRAKTNAEIRAETDRIKNDVYALVANKDRYRFNVTVQQHIGTNLLLVRGGTPRYQGRSAASGDFALFGYPNAEKITDGAQLELFLGVFLEPYQYTTVTGALRTIPQVIYVPAEKVASATPRPGDWMWSPDRRNPLSREKPKTLTESERLSEIARRYGTNPRP